MALPTSRDITLASSSPFPSALGNKLQDCVIGGKHGTRTIIIGPAAFVTGAVGSYATAGQPFVFNSTTDAAYADPRFFLGNRIIAMRAYIRDVAGQPLLAQMLRADRAGLSASVLISPASASSGADQTLTLAADTSFALPYTIDHASFELRVVRTGTGAAACRVYGFEIDIDTP